MISFLGSQGWFWINWIFPNWVSLMVAFLCYIAVFSAFSSFSPSLRHTVSPTDISLNDLDFKWRCYINLELLRAWKPVCWLISYMNALYISYRNAFLNSGTVYLDQYLVFIALGGISIHFHPFFHRLFFILFPTSFPVSCVIAACGILILWFVSFPFISLHCNQ